MSRYNDPRVIEWSRSAGGKRRALRDLKRFQAEHRNPNTLPENRRRARCPDSCGHVTHTRPSRHQKEAGA